MNPSLRLRTALERLRSSLWVLPSVSVVIAVVAGTLLPSLEFGDDTRMSELVYGGGAGSAQALLGQIAGATATVVGTVFSLTVVALQLASSQYSPRLLRNFLRKRGTQVVLSVFLGTFAYCLAVLRSVREPTEVDPSGFVPGIAVTVAMLLALGAIAALVWFIHDITQSIRIETIVSDVEAETVAAVDRVHPDPADGAPRTRLPGPPERARTVLATRSGYVQEVDEERLAADAIDQDAVVRLDATPGDYLVAGTRVAWTWSLEPDAGAALDEAAAERLLAAAVRVGSERSTSEDVGYGLLQLADIAAKALSPGVNDPTTAVQALGPSATIVVRLAGRRIDHDVQRDESGRIRAAVPKPDFAAYLDLAVGVARRHGAGQPSVVRAALLLLHGAAAAARTDEVRTAVVDELERLLAAVRREVDDDADLGALLRQATRVRAAVADRDAPDDAVPAD